MKKKTRYVDGPLGDYAIVDDFLPSPENLVRKHENIRVTINLNRTSVGYFKTLARDSHTQYQKIIRSLLDYYASRQLSTTKN
ncbi:MAG: CopG family transcriptional regulator [Fibrobacterota bacterium]